MASGWPCMAWHEMCTYTLVLQLESKEMRGEEGNRQQQAAGSDELDELARALQGFEPETGQSNKPPQEPQ